MKIVGKKYTVPHVLSKPAMGYSSNEGWVPVMGSFDRDNDKGVFTAFRHWHIDFRFMSPHTFACWMLNMDTSFVFNECHIADVLAAPTMMRVTCYRETPEWPRARFMMAGDTYGLETMFKGKCLIKGRCPHKGIAAEDMHRNGNVLTCPSHGLRFDARTGMVITDPVIK